jgi:GNAT superfamily N-acetyltransferase
LDIKFEHAEDTDGAIQNKLLQLLIGENTRKAGVAQIDRSIICIKDPESGEVQGGIWTEILFDWMYIEILFVPEELRGRGIGAWLVKQIEDIAVAKGCVGVWLETFAFQAPEFYLKQGYEEFAHLDDYPRGSKRSAGS